LPSLQPHPFATPHHFQLTCSPLTHSTKPRIGRSGAGTRAKHLPQQYLIDVECALARSLL
jgi:hypothetical protein